MIDFKNLDCLVGMKQFTDKHFDLAIVDPPYFSGPERRQFYGRKISPIGVQRLYTETDTWELPTAEYFDELFRVSKQQIIWEVNYFSNYTFGPGRIVWDKVNGKSTFSDCEIAYCSLHNSVRQFRYMWNGMLQGKSIEEGHIARGNKKTNEKRIHPTQKPIDLYKWLLQKYAGPNDLILDTHVGSGSSLIACRELGFDCVGFEINPVYFELATARLENEETKC